MAKHKLGRGLKELMSDVGLSDESVSPRAQTPTPSIQEERQGSDIHTTIPQSGLVMVAIDKLVRNPAQPRRIFDKKELADLANSIAMQGLLQPLLVRPIHQDMRAKSTQKDMGNAHYQIVAGERRWLASWQIGLTHLPVLVRDLSDREVLEIGVVENVQRTDLNPVEEALAYQALRTQFSRSQEEIAQATGKSRSYIANSLRLLNLPEGVRKYLEDGSLQAGHGRAVLSAKDPQSLADAIAKQGLSVRKAEHLARRSHQTEQTVSLAGSLAQHTHKDANIRFIEGQLQDSLGMEVSLVHNDPQGKLTIRYKDLGQLDDVITRLKR